VELLATAADSYSGIPWVHVSIDLWTAPGSRLSYGAVALRDKDSQMLGTVEKSLGVLSCLGRHNQGNIVALQREVLRRVGLVDADIASTTTDSGSNFRKAEAEVDAPWVPCAAHALNVAVLRALGATGKSFDRRAERVARGGPAARRWIKV